MAVLSTGNVFDPLFTVGGEVSALTAPAFTLGLLGFPVGAMVGCNRAEGASSRVERVAKSVGGAFAGAFFGAWIGGMVLFLAAVLFWVVVLGYWVVSFLRPPTDRGLSRGT